MPNNVNSTTSGDTMNNSTTTNNKRSAFSNTVRSQASNSGGFDFSSAADIGLKSLVAATCGVVLYKTLASDSSK